MLLLLSSRSKGWFSSGSSSESEEFIASVFDVEIVIADSEAGSATGSEAGDVEASNAGADSGVSSDAAGVISKLLTGVISEFVNEITAASIAAALRSTAVDVIPDIGRCCCCGSCCCCCGCCCCCCSGDAVTISVPVPLSSLMILKWRKSEFEKNLIEFP